MANYDPTRPTHFQVNKTYQRGQYNRGRHNNWRGNYGNRFQFYQSRKSNPPSSGIAFGVGQPVSDGIYNGWKLYFHEETYKAESYLATKLQAIENYVTDCQEMFKYDEIKSKKMCIFDFKKMSINENFLRRWPTFEEDLSNDPRNVLDIMGLAIHQIISVVIASAFAVFEEEECDGKIDVPKIQARIVKFTSISPLKQIKTSHYGKFVCVRGTVIRVSSCKVQTSRMAFLCNECDYLMCVRQPDGIFTTPNRCVNRNCKNHRNFTAQLSSPYTETFDYQCIRIQEILSDDNQPEGGRIPRTIDCELSGDLASSCAPGDVVTVTGIVKIRAEDNTKKMKSAIMHSLFLEAVGISGNKSVESERNSQNVNESNSMEFTADDYQSIRDIQGESNIFRFLVNSLCPSIYGHEMVKAGLLLSLFGGSHSEDDDCREHIHILVVGDPGLGKSQMLKACSYVAPRGIFVCGNTTTTSGLTVTLSREEGGDYSLEAGALVLADQGVCCIDEFDKMHSQHQALLEVMEQQTVSIAKAGVICTLPARTTVLAAANPSGGHYNKAKTVAENLRLGQALLSRFDLVFILLDQPNENMDSLLSAHVIQRHQQTIYQTSNYSFQKSNVWDFDNSRLQSESSLTQRLKISQSEEMPQLSAEALRKYIAYATKYVACPKLSENAIQAIQEFYLQLRSNNYSQDCTPVTTRQLYSLIRLTQARAKLELKEEATLEHALDVIELMRWSLLHLLTDETGALDFQRSQHGSGMSKSKQVKKFLSVLHRESEIQARSIFTFTEMKEIANRTQLRVDDFISFVETLNTQGFLLKKGGNSYQIQSAG